MGFKHPFPACCTCRRKQGKRNISVSGLFRCGRFERRSSRTTLLRFILGSKGNEVARRFKQRTMPLKQSFLTMLE